ncbi:MAG: GTP cyclohydrolase I [Pedobacter sp.]|nr:GTP cyclohydrolase I [Pedobacter sp.]
MSTKSDTDLEIAISQVLQQAGENTTRDGLLETPMRFKKQLQECLIGYNDNPEKYVKLFDSNGYKEIVVVSKISFSSLCEHHLLPFFGYIDIAYVPKHNILGLSKFARIVDAFSKRLQVQERLTKELADFFQEQLDPELIIVQITATHTCMTVRGVQRPQSQTNTLTVIGNEIKNRRHIDYFFSMNGGN